MYSVFLLGSDVSGAVSGPLAFSHPNNRYYSILWSVQALPCHKNFLRPFTPKNFLPKKNRIWILPKFLISTRLLDFKIVREKKNPFRVLCKSIYIFSLLAYIFLSDNLPCAWTFQSIRYCLRTEPKTVFRLPYYLKSFYTYLYSFPIKSSEQCLVSSSVSSLL